MYTLPLIISKNLDLFQVTRNRYFRLQETELFSLFLCLINLTDAIFHTLEEKKREHPPHTHYDCEPFYNRVPEAYFVRCRLGELSQRDVRMYG